MALKWDEVLIKQYIENEEYECSEITKKEYGTQHRKAWFVTLRCKNKNHSEYEMMFTNFLQGTRCRECFNENKSKITELKIVAIRDFVESEGYTLLEVYKSNFTSNYISVKCNNPSHMPYKTLFSNFKSGCRCRQCDLESRTDIAIDKLIKHAEQEGYNVIRSFRRLSGSKDKIRTYVEMSCPNANHDAYIVDASAFRDGVRCLKCFHEERSKCMSGINNHQYNPNITDDERICKRNTKEYFTWRSEVYIRDKYTCQICNDSSGGNLNAHHLDGYNWCKEKRTDTTNGITLCETCHNLFHLLYGMGNNTKEQYSDFLTRQANGEFQDIILHNTSDEADQIETKGNSALVI